MDTADQTYSYWLKAVADPVALRAREFRITSDPQAGFYRTKKGEPVAIFWDGDELVVTVDGQELAPHRHEACWLHVALRPVSEEDYNSRLETGKWPDEDGAVARERGERRDPQTPADYEEVIEDLGRDVSDYAKIDSDEAAARAAGLRNRINEYAASADKQRTELKAPHLKAGQEIDRLWQPPIKHAKDLNEMLRKSIAAWETLKLKAQRDAEAQNRPSNVPPPAAQVRPTHGRAVAVRTKREVAEIEDADALFAYLKEHARQDIYPAMLAIAQRLVNGGSTPAGVRIEEVAHV